MNDIHEAQAADGGEDGYYVSISDMLVGLLFLFIILLMYFALQLRSTTETLVTAEQTRNELLQKVATYLRERDVEAEADFAAGVLRLPDRSLFQKGQDTPKPAGLTALGVLAEALNYNMPCYSYLAAAPRPDTCGATSHHLEAVFIEGHTDSDPVTASARIRDNWDLSAARAASTYRELLSRSSRLGQFLSSDPATGAARPVFSVAGYSDQRPVAEGDDEASKSKNRRIDIRFVMAGPDAGQ